MKTHYVLFLWGSALLLGVLVFSTWRKTVTLRARGLTALLGALILYLSLPTGLFLLSLPWKMPFRLTAAIIALFFTFKTLQGLKRNPPFSRQVEYQCRLGFVVLFQGLLLVSYAGLLWGHLFVQDWPKHRGVLLCLYQNPMNPTLSGFDCSSHPLLRDARLVYYYGHYEVSAYLVRALSCFLPALRPELILRLLEISFAFWLMLGMGLLVLLLPAACEGLFGRRGRKSWGVFYLGILLFSGLNYWCKEVGWGLHYISFLFLPPQARPFMDDLFFQWEKLFGQFGYLKGLEAHAEWCTPYFAQIGSVLSDWQWTPQHLVAGLTTVVLLGLYGRQFDRFPVFIWSTSALATSLLCWIGSWPLVALIFLYFGREVCRGRGFKVLRDRLWRAKWEWLGAGLFILLILQFYRTVSSSVLLSDTVTRFYGESSSSPVLSVNPSLSLRDGLFRILLFYVIEFLPFVLLLVPPLKKDPRNPSLKWVCLFWIGSLCVFVLGGNNDLVMRGTVPAVLILACYGSVLIEERMDLKGKWGRACVVLFFLLMIPCFMNELIMGWVTTSKVVENDPRVLMQYAGRSLE